MTIEPSALPAPLVPAEVDLRGFKFMPIDVQRLLKSETWALGTGDERAAAMALWLEAWHQVPAGSLPNNDRMLKKLADTDKWPRVRQQALRGWVECSDGRLYHPVTCEKVLEAWIEKLANSISGAVGNAKRWNVGIDTRALRAQFITAVEMLRAIAPQSESLKKKVVAVILAGSPPESPPDPSDASPPESPPESGGDRKGQGQGQGQGLVNTEIPSLLPQAPALPPEDRQQPEAQLTLVDPPPPRPSGPPDCPHQAVLALWAEVLPAMPQHLPSQWKGSRADHLRARWRETAVEKGWTTEDQGLAYLRKLFAYVGASEFLTGRAKPRDPGKRPFVIELEWLVNPTNWAKVHEGKYHPSEGA